MKYDGWSEDMSGSEVHCDFNSSRQLLCSGKDERWCQSWVELAAESTCVLSILGSMATIASYLVLKEMKHIVRQILFHLSIMTLIASTANLVGLLLDYNKNLCPVCVDGRVVYPSRHTTYHYLCQIQGVFSSYGTVGSVLWTLGLVVYLYYRIVLCDLSVTMRIVRVMYVVCYALPLYVSLWLLLDGWIGYAPWSPTHKGWCTTVNAAGETDRDAYKMTLFMIDDIWIMLGTLVITTVTFTTHAHIINQVITCSTMFCCSPLLLCVCHCCCSLDDCYIRIIIIAIPNYS